MFNWAKNDLLACGPIATYTPIKYFLPSRQKLPENTLHNKRSDFVRIFFFEK